MRGDRDVQEIDRVLLISSMIFSENRRALFGIML